MKISKGGDSGRVYFPYLRYLRKSAALTQSPGDCPVELLLNEKDIRQAETDESKRLKKKGLPASWSKVGVVFEDQYILVIRDAVRFHSGRLGTYIRILEKPTSSPGVVIMPRYKEKIVLIRHFRHATRQWHLELPRGFAKSNVSVADNAKRELTEEIGAEAVSLVQLGTIYANSGLLASPIEVLLAEIENIGRVDGEEGISGYRLCSLNEITELVSTGQITDGITLAAISLANSKGNL